MDPLLWWTILLCLVIILTILSLYLGYGLYEGGCRQRSANNSISTSKNVVKLNKYMNDIAEVEFLTSIERKHSNISSKLYFVCESGSAEQLKTSCPHFSSCQLIKHRRGSLLPDIHENCDCSRGLYSTESIMTDVVNGKSERRKSELPPRRFSLVTEGMRKNSLATLPRRLSLRPGGNDTSTDTLDCLDPINIEIKRDMADIEEEVQKVNREINYFFGGSKNLKYYEISEKLIRLNLALSDIECQNEELRKRKKEIQAFVSETKEKLNSKVP